MLGKLLKYDLKYMVQNMSLFYILCLFFAVTTRILFSIDQTVIIKIISQISVGCLFAMVFNILINTVMRSWVRFSDSIYKDESYLTHTLPVTKNAIYDSKFIQTLVFFTIGFIIVILSLFIAYYTEERWELLKGIINGLSTSLNVNTTFFVIGFLAVVFLEVFNAIQCGFLGMILGNRKNNNKNLLSVVFGLIAYMASQIIVLILMFIIGMFNNNIMDLFTSEVLLTNSSIKLLIILAIVIYLIAIIVMNITSKIVFNKGVNVE